MAELALNRSHRSRLTQIWRSAGWPCKDGIELDLLAAGMLAQQLSPEGRETLRLTEAGIAWLAQQRQQQQRPLSAHDRLAQRFAEELLAEGRIVWHELSLRALIASEPVAADDKPPLWDEAEPPPPSLKNSWRMARPDLFSVRNTSVEAYLRPQVHEIKFSRADLLSDLRHAAKRQAYEWLCCECFYVFPAGVAQPNEIPEQFGIWVLQGSLAEGRFELLRPARHCSRSLPFAVWLALAKATPLHSEREGLQARLGEDDAAPELP